MKSSGLIIGMMALLAIVALAAAALPPAQAVCVACASDNQCGVSFTGGTSCTVTCIFPEPCKCKTSGTCHVPIPPPRPPILAMNSLHIDW